MQRRKAGKVNQSGLLDRQRSDTMSRTLASCALELLEEVLGKRLVEISRNTESARAPPEGSWFGGDWFDRPDLRERTAVAHDQERFACLDAAEKGRRVALDFLNADG